MAKVLIVDDSAFDRQRAGKLLELQPGVPALEFAGELQAVYASDGQEALTVVEAEKPDVVVTDLQMPGMDGLNLVRRIRVKYPFVPVILMTSQGSEEIAIEALQCGAASYVPKRNLAQDLRDTVEVVLASAQAKRDHARLLDCLRQTESHFVLDNDPSLIPPLVGHLKDSLFRMSGSDETGLVRVTVALREAVLNAMYHGNLEVDSGLHEHDERAFHRLVEERRQQEPYRSRRVHVTGTDAPGESVYVVRDEGPGFDPSKLADPTDPTNLENVGGRGLLLIRTFMAEVRHNERGNEITMVWRTGRS
jgi:CheY-like chemotaxis protein/anti-sigma regulatory factor (Ser/Thr protein kinase)